MAKVTVNKPKPVVVPPPTYILELTENEALYVHAVLGTQNNILSLALGFDTDPAWMIYDSLHDVLVGEGHRSDNLDAQHDIVRKVLKEKYGS